MSNPATTCGLCGDRLHYGACDTTEPTVVMVEDARAPHDSDQRRRGRDLPDWVQRGFLVAWRERTGFGPENTQHWIHQSAVVVARDIPHALEQVVAVRRLMGFVSVEPLSAKLLADRVIM
ncbi:MAG: hypothetical protein QN187_17920 [Armatimonadota bacterium]|nr:hypothetical protein [Armatimonadota bacterium]